MYKLTCSTISLNSSRHLTKMILPRRELDFPVLPNILKSHICTTLNKYYEWRVQIAVIEFMIYPLIISYFFFFCILLFCKLNIAKIIICFIHYLKEASIEQTKQQHLAMTHRYYYICNNLFDICK
jgi:hypothetical protein